MEEVQIDKEELENETKTDKGNFLNDFRRKRYCYLLIHQMNERNPEQVKCRRSGKIPTKQLRRKFE